MNLKKQVTEARGQAPRDCQSRSGSGLCRASPSVEQTRVGWGGDASIFSLMNSRPSRSKLEKCGPGLKVPLLETWKIRQRHNPHLIQDSRKRMIWFQRVKGKYRSFQIHIKSLSCRSRLIPASLPREEDSPGLQAPGSWHPSETPRTLSLEEYLL